MSQGSESTEVLCMEVMEHVHFTLNESVIQAVIRCHSSVIQGVIKCGNACGHGLQYVPSDHVSLAN